MLRIISGQALDRTDRGQREHIALLAFIQTAVVGHNCVVVERSLNNRWEIQQFLTYLIPLLAGSYTRISIKS